MVDIQHGALAALVSGIIGGLWTYSYAVSSLTSTGAEPYTWVLAPMIAIATGYIIAHTIFFLSVAIVMSRM